MRRAAFLDRDGVINRKAAEGQYVTNWDEIDFLPGVAPAIAQLNRAGFWVIVVSNQRCVAKGLISAADLDSIHRRMCEALAGAGATIDGVYYCPHEEEPPCGCRKPAPGMLLRAACEHRVDLTASWMVGDSEVDVKAGRNAGCKTVRLLNRNDVTDGTADVVAPSLPEAVHQILQWERNQSAGMEHDRPPREADVRGSSKSVGTIDKMHIGEDPPA
jgi:D-glycero-D-manno-heptose 1,7-bisphosphate phosphatase